MKFCSTCGSDKLQFIVPERDHKPRYVCRECHTIHYENPRIIVGCLAVYEDKILLCKRAISPQKGLWNLPAGFLENGEKAEEGAIRETYEEAMAAVDIVRLHVLFSLPQVNQVYLHFLAKMKEPEFSTTYESSAVRLFTQNEIPWDELAFESTRFALQKYFENGAEFEGVHIGSFVKKELWMGNEPGF